MGIDSLLLNETGCYIQENPLEIKFTKETFDVLWVGKMDFRKQLALALKTMAAVESHEVKLHIVGGGDMERYRQQATALGIMNRCVWHGAVSHDEVQALMRQSDVFLFTSVAEGTPHVVLEAICNNLPVVCFDTCGQGDVVDDAIGRKISLSTPRQSAREFASIINF